MSNNFGPRKNRTSADSARERLQQLQPQQKRLTVQVSPLLHKRFQIAVAQQDRTMTEVVTEFMEDYIRRHEQ